MSSNFVQVCPNEYEFDFTCADQVLSQPRSAKPVAVGKYFVDDLRIAGVFNKQLDPLLADWIDVAMFVYLTDRLSPRRRRTNQYHSLQWGRNLYLKVPVRKPEVWTRWEIYESLRRILRFFTEDDWQIEFVQGNTQRPSESQYSLLPVWQPSPVRVALYSGGLDSFAGTVQQIAAQPEHQFVLVSGVTNTRQGEAQREQVRAISKAAPRPVIHVPVSYGLRQGIERAEEIPQRSRGFLFKTLGAVTAIAAGASELYIYENGIGAINLPYDGSQVGTSNTRAVNPIALLRMSKFISDLTGSAFHIQNPFLFQTKSEMCCHPEVRRLINHIELTFSCDGFPIRKQDQPQCGICTSCLLRRLSLESAGFSGSDSNYLHDLLSEQFGGGPKRLSSLWVMDWQAQRIATALSSPEPWQTLRQEF